MLPGSRGTRQRPRPRLQRARIVAAAAALLALATGCGDDPESGVAEDLKDDPATEGSTAPPPDHSEGAAVPTALWVTASGSGEVYHVDVATGEVETVELGHNLYDVEFGDGAVWLAGAADALHRLDLATRDVAEVVSGGVREVVVTGDQVWIAQGEPAGVAPVDADSGTVGEPVATESISGMVAADGVLWAWADFGSELTRVDTASGEVTSGHVASGLGAVVVDGDALYAAGATQLSRVDPTTLQAEEVAQLPARATAALAGPDGGVVWLGYEGGSVASYDVSTGTLSDPVSVAGDDISALAFVDGSVWTGAEDGSLVRLDARTLEAEESVELPGAADQLRIAVER